MLFCSREHKKLNWRKNEGVTGNGSLFRAEFHQPKRSKNLSANLYNPLTTDSGSCFTGITGNHKFGAVLY